MRSIATRLEVADGMAWDLDQVDTLETVCVRGKKCITRPVRANEKTVHSKATRENLLTNASTGHISCMYIADEPDSSGARKVV